MDNSTTYLIGLDNTSMFGLNTTDRPRMVYEDNLYYVPAGLVILLSILYGTISLVTVIGNCLVILVIIKNKSMQTVTNFYIANLAVADVLIGIFSIPFQFQAALLQRWDLPPILCTISPFFKEMTVNVSICTLTVISTDRYFAVIHPLKPRCSWCVAKAIMFLVWIFSLVSALPMIIVFHVSFFIPWEGAERRPVCNGTFPVLNGVDTGKLYRLYLAVLQYFFPLVIICYAYFRVIYRIWGNQAPGSAMDARDQVLNRNKRKVIKMLIIVVALFAFCWLPLQTYNLLAEVFSEINNFKYINIIYLCSNWLAMSNSCYNPFIYGLCNAKYKHAFRMLFRKCPCRSCRPTNKSDHYLEPSDANTHTLTTKVDTMSVNVNGRLKKYVRVNHNESTFV